MTFFASLGTILSTPRVVARVAMPSVAEGGDAPGGQVASALVLAGIIALFASLESGFGLCVGCKAFFLGMRLGLVPPSVCEDCAPFLRA